jgi:predicted metal-dependent enzyme (double-stranded beta helix superfamily)
MSAAPVSVADSWLAALCQSLNSGADATRRGDAAAVAESLVSLAQREDCPQAADLADADLACRRVRLACAEGTSQSCLLIAWAAGATTPLHDHSGLWGVELVLDGALQVDEFAPIDMPPHGALICRRNLLLGLGDAATFGGANYLHRCRNLSDRRPALSLHVYGGNLHRYRVFEPAQAAWTSRQVQAPIDAVVP